MIVVFEKEYLMELYVVGKCSDKKHRFQPDIVRRYIDRINTLKSKESIESLYNLKSLHYEVLKGDKMGISSIRVNDQYRIEFTIRETSEEPVLTSAILLNNQTITIDMIKLTGVAPDKIANNLIPFDPTHPGELIRDELEACNIT